MLNDKNWASVRRGEVFRKVGSTNMADWKFNGSCMHKRRFFCELCGTEIVWVYGLTNKVTSQTLWIGSECIKWYYEFYSPNGLELAIEFMKNAHKITKTDFINSKTKEWADLGNGWVVDYLLGPERRGYRDARLACDVSGCVDHIPVSKFRASLRRKGYLHQQELDIFRTGYERAPNGKKWDEEFAVFSGEDRNAISG